MKLSVVIACYNAETTIAEQLEALAQQRWSEPWEVIVVNNRSTDRSTAIAESYRQRLPNLRVVDALAKQGAAYAMNVGVGAATSQFIAFCDADDVVADGWVAAMGQALQQYAFVSGPFEIHRLNQSPLARSRRNPQPTGIQQYTHPPFLPHAGCGNMGVQRAAFDSVNGFDESMLALFDTDFCWRLQLRGIPLTPVADAVLHVRYRDSVGRLLRQACHYAEHNVLLYKRYRPLGMPKLDVKSGIRAWIDLIRAAPDLLHEETRARYLWDLGWRTGRIYGSIKYRVLSL
ncbi:MAG: glycosyltransferase family 2 protein [Gammaproteobacteria bacterium]|nr:glycosyltransferase family 2 protein [Gammaproteobacteria bacterium]